MVIKGEIACYGKGPLDPEEQTCLFFIFIYICNSVVLCSVLCGSLCSNGRQVLKETCIKHFYI